MISKKTINRTQLGARIEKQAEQWLKDRGVKVVARNFRSRFGEIDMIGLDRNFLVFFEVRYRSREKFGGAAASVDRRKQQKLWKTAEYYLATHHRAAAYPCRFDVVAVSIHNELLDFSWYKSAFSETDRPDAF